MNRIRIDTKPESSWSIGSLKKKLFLTVLIAVSSVIASTSSAATAPVKGVVLQRYFDNFTSGTPEDLLADPRYPNSPTFTTYEPLFEYPPGNPPYIAPAQGSNEAGDNYGNELSGILFPPVTGDYIFYLSSDD